jgi:hypothetical protein
MSGPWAEQPIDLCDHARKHYLAQFAHHGGGGPCTVCPVAADTRRGGRCRPQVDALVVLVSAGVVPPAAPPRVRWASLLATPVLVVVMSMLVCGGLTVVAAVV